MTIRTRDDLAWEIMLIEMKRDSFSNFMGTRCEKKELRRHAKHCYAVADIMIEEGKKGEQQ